MFTRLLLGALLLSSAACTVTVDGDSVLVTEERRFTVTGSPEVTLTTFDGSIEVRSWDRNEVLVQVEKRAHTERDAEALQVEASQNGDAIRIEAPTPRVREEFFGWGASVALVVTAPKSVTLRAQTGDGSIAVQDLDGLVELRSGDGSIRIDRVNGDVRVNTGDGSIRALGVVGQLDLSSGDGSIEARGRFTALRADSGDGSMTLEADPGSTMERDWTVTTGDGSITIRVPEDFNAELDAESGDGTITADAPSTRALATPARRRDGDQPPVLHTRLGTGGRTLLLRSGDGSIRVIAR
jgi:DUF4097 and DUF4098 domain-containing protein YvlB